MKKQIIAAGIVGLMMLAGITIMAEAGTEENPEVIPLLAGQDMLVGNVTIWNDADNNVYVNYTVDKPDWYLMETHLHIATCLDDIPQTEGRGRGRGGGGGGNPIPGNFYYKNESYDLYTTTDEYMYELPDGFELDGTLYVAAHAVVGHMDTMWVYSDATETYVAHNGSTCPGAYMERTGTAVWAWDGAWGTLADNYDYGQWIWESEYVLHPVCGDVVNFTKTFDIPGQPVEGNLKIGVDNAYNAYLNDCLVGGLGLNPGWYNSDLKEAYVESGFVWDISNYPLLNLEEGENTFLFACANEYSNDDDEGEPLGTITNNPGGLIYEAEITYIDIEETAWADGERFTRRGNWATYFTYQIQTEFDTLVLSYSTDMENWEDVPGAYNSYTLDLDDNSATTYFLNVTSFETNIPLATGQYGFYVVPAEQDLTWWAAKDVTEAYAIANPDSWQAYMWEIINGNEPIFYLDVTVSDYQLVDGLQLDWPGSSSPGIFLIVNGDYPHGAYHYTGTITNMYSVDSDITVEMNFA
ncbi:MAG: hypothetical protein ACP5FL_09140 [Thermoplasmatota archaeon]